MSAPVRDREAVFLGGGEMGALMRGLDWSKTALGPVCDWPQSLLTSVSTCLDCAFPILICWGPDLVMLYNDEYRPILGSEKHPAALGARGREVWSELWDVIGPMMEQVISTGKATRSRDLMLLMNRHGFQEETYFSFSYSPIRDETGGVGGVFIPVIETTAQVIGERRLRTLRELASAAGPASVEGAIRSALEVLARNDRDVPFALVYAAQDDGPVFRLAGAFGVEPDRHAAPRELDRASLRFGDEGPGPGPALVIPITPAGRERASVVLVAGINPLRPFDEEHRAFFDLVAGQIGQSLADALAFEEERRRAATLAELDQAKTEFFSNISHEFRTPLSLILGSLEPLRRDPELNAAEVRGPVEAAYRNGMRLLKLVNTLLDFSRIEAGRIQANFSPVDLAAFTAEIAASFRSLFERANLDFEVTGCPLGQAVYIDAGLWEKVVLNLVSNAFKFTWTGAVRVTVRPAPGGDGAELIVADTGVGIPEAELPRLFERFHRVENTAGRSYEGSGIGLALVRELVALHGGTISVDSRPGQGSTFTVRLRFGSSHLPADRVRETHSPDMGAASRAEFLAESSGWLEPAPAETDPQFSPLSATKGRVLLADDNADMRQYLARLLLADGYQVESVADGEAALRLALARPPDLVLADVMMPTLDGLGLLRALRADARTAETPVILLSARAGEEAKVEGLESGADDYLAKPFSSRELSARVQAAIRLAETRREANQALRRSEEQLRLATEAAEVGLWDVEGGFGSLYWPASVKAMFGLAPDVHVSLDDFFAGLHPDDREATTAAYLAAADPARRALYDVEYRTIGRDDGVVRWVAAKGRGVFDGGGRCVRVIGTAIDISRRKADEARLLELNATLERRVAEALAERKVFADVVEGTDALVVVVDMDFRLLAINRAAAREFERVYGVRPVVGASLLRGLENRPDHARAVRDLWGRALAGEEFSLVEEFGDPRFDRRAYEVKFNSLRGADGVQIGAFQFVTDVTHRVRERERLAQAEEQLRHSQKMEAMGQLTGGVAHDFNNLLMPIIGSLDMIQRKSIEDARTARMVDGALKAAERAKMLVHRLLAFARRQPLQPQAVDVGKLIHGMADLIASSLGPRIHLVVDVDRDLPAAVADPNQLEMALLNLAVNGRDAMPEGGTLRLTARLEPRPERLAAKLPTGPYLCIGIVDTGVGMDKVTLTRATEPFFSTKGVGKGTGLGLSMAHGLAAQLGGALALQSEPGAGTTVEIWLPIAETAANPPSSLPGATDVEAQSGTALLVDDEDIVRASLVEMLRELGYEVVEAETAEAAAALVGQGLTPDILITDHLMPGMTGPELISAVHERLPRLPALIISGYADVEGLAPRFARLTKPFWQHELAEALATVLDSRAARASAVQVNAPQRR